MAASGPVSTDKTKQGEAAAVCVASSHGRPRSILDDSHLCKEGEQDKKRAKRDKAAGGSFGPAKQVQQVRSRRREVRTMAKSIWLDQHIYSRAISVFD